MSVMLSAGPRLAVLAAHPGSMISTGPCLYCDVCTVHKTLRKLLRTGPSPVLPGDCLQLNIECRSSSLFGSICVWFNTMASQLRKNGACSLACAAMALAVVLPVASGILLPIVPLPISFNFGGASPMSMDVACSWGTVVEVDGAKQVRQGCGAARHSWKVVQEAGAGSGSEVALGPLASQEKLTLTLSPNRGQGTWRCTGSLNRLDAAPN